MFRSIRAYVFYKRDVLQNVAKFTEKHVWRSLFLKMLSLQLYLKRLWRRYFPVNFSKLLRATFLQNTSRLVLLNADDWKNPRDCWSKLSLFSPLRFLIFNDSILTALFRRCKNFIFKLFTKERKISSEFSEIFALLSMFFMFDHCWKGCKSFINICYLHDFFPCSFQVILALVKFLIIFLFLLSISWTTVLIKIFSDWHTFCAVFPYYP